jgi:K+-transporting ATPase ATPase B chain
VRYKGAPAAEVLRSNLLLYGLGGILIPFPGIKLVDMLLVGLRLV